MKIVADENMPGLDCIPAPDELQRLPGRSLGREALRDADVLLVRSVTRVDAALLEGTPVRFVGSATIGTDHVDLAWLARQGIGFAHAPGCNARAVAEYVLQAVLIWILERGLPPEQLRVGVVGVGNVGMQVAGLLGALGCRILPCDPPRQQRREDISWPWASLDEAMAADVVTLHTPLTMGGLCPTHHMVDASRLAHLNADQLLINSGRGAVIDNVALLARLLMPQPPAVVLDVWEGEPAISVPLFRQVWKGTPHIAGYSVEGRLRGTRAVLDALGRWRGDPVGSIAVSAPEEGWSKDVLELTDLLALLQHRYLLEEDHRLLGEVLDGGDPAGGFDRLRRDYRPRHECSGMRLAGSIGERCRRVLTRLDAVR